MQKMDIEAAQLLALMVNKPFRLPFNESVGWHF